MVLGSPGFAKCPAAARPRSSSTPIINDRPQDSPYGVKFSELHAIDLVDMDGDGLKDIVTGKRFWSHGRTGDPDRNSAGRAVLVQVGPHVR